MMTFRQYCEVEDYKDQIASFDFESPKGSKISIGRLAAFAKSKPEYLQTIPVSKVAHDLSWWQGDNKRMIDSDTSYPILVIITPSGGWTVADGLNRLKKVVSVEKKKTIKAYLLPFDQLPISVFLK